MDPVRFTTWTCVAQMGYHPRYAPNGAKKPYNALIRGRDTKATFNRDFVAKEFCVDRSIVPALLESRDVTKKGAADDTYFLLLPGSDPEECIRQILTKEDAIWLAAQMDAGRNLIECWDVASGKILAPTPNPAPRSDDASMDPKKTIQDLRQALLAALEYIDALPKDVVDTLPAMPGFDRDEVDALLARTQEGSPK